MSDERPSPPRNFQVLDASWDYGKCGFCGCNTNAKRRACCKDGQREDDEIGQHAPPEFPDKVHFILAAENQTNKTEDK